MPTQGQTKHVYFENLALLHKYQNGNCTVEIYEDGTKVRSWPDGESPNPIWPESIDVKITNRCKCKCPYCHESCTARGQHADGLALNWIVEDAEVPYGLELAIGGGDVLLHPDIEAILRDLCLMQLIPNLTLRWDQIIVNRTKLLKLKRQGLYYGLGVSNPDEVMVVADYKDPIFDANTVAHYVVGVDDVPVQPGWPKMLVLGYKRRGRGKAFWSKDVQNRINEWRYWLPQILVARTDGLGGDNCVVSFDNLALEQLEVQKRVKPEVWQQYFMGNDGQFTFFYDAVTDSYAASSSCEKRIPRNGKSLKEVFADVRSSVQ